MARRWVVGSARLAGAFAVAALTLAGAVGAGAVPGGAPGPAQPAPATQPAPAGPANPAGQAQPAAGPAQAAPVTQTGPANPAAPAQPVPGQPAQAKPTPTTAAPRAPSAPAKPLTEEQALKAAYARAQAALKQASSLVGRRQYHEARAILEPLEQNPDPTIRWPALFWRARSYHDQGDPTTAIPLFEEVSRGHEPLAAQAEYWIGQGWVRLGRMATAREHFRRGAERATDSFKESCLYQVAYAHYMERHYARATRLFREFIDAYPSSSLVSSACTLSGTSETRLHAARRVGLQFTGSVGITSGSQVIRFNAPLELGLGANARLGSSLRWEPRDGMRVSASAYGTRTSYLMGDLSDRAGMVGSLSFSHDLGDARSFSYGLSYSTNQQVDVVTSDSTTYGLSSSYSMPFARDGRLGLGLSLSRLKYRNAATSGTQGVFSGVYSEPISRLASISLGAGLTRSDVGAGYLSYSGFSLSGSLTHRFGGRSTLRGGLSHTVNDFDAPAPKRKVSRSDHTRRYFVEWTQRVTTKIALTVGWEENRRGSNQASLNRTDPSWYVRTSQLFDVKF